MSDQTEQMPDERDTEGRLLSIIGMNYTILRAGDRRIADHSKAAQIDAAKQREGLKRMRDLRQIGYTIETDRPGDGREFRYRMVTA